jgi:adenylate cyclase
MGENEAETVKTLTAYRKIMGELIQQHRGRVVDSPGDNILAEFASVVDAVQCSVAAQNEFKARNAELPENRRMEFRIGVNLGDVIEEENRIYGDGVNIAARLEALADPGGICISKTAFDQIETKLPLGYEYLGDQTVKNITKPVGAYRVLMDPRVTVAGAKEKKPSIPLWRKKGILVGAAAVLVVLIGVAVWNFYWRAPKIEPASKERMALPLPDKPSIAVLPFVNMSDDPKQEFFSDGITENIITALSKVPRLLVIARNSTFTYKGKPVKFKQVSEELGVQYVLEGSVQKSADRIRITVQLIDALKGHHIWAERYDRDLKDLFALQDEITIRIITALQVKLTAGETAQLVGKSTKNLQAYQKVLEARESFYTITKEGFGQARRLSEEAIALDPEYAAAYLYLGSTHFMDVTMGSSKTPEESLKLAFEFTRKAIALDDSEPTAHSILGFLYVMTKQYDQGIAECERAIALAPNSANASIWMGNVLTLFGRHEEAVRYAEQALRLDPLPVGWYFRGLGNAYFGAGRYEEAIAAHRKALQRAPNDIVTHLALTTAYSGAGRLEEARAQAAEVLRINPKFSVEQSEKRSLWKNQADGERYYGGLRKGGLPDKPPLPLPDKPSIAVLPFVNMSEDKSQEFFSDGLTEEIITALSKTPQIFVIASNTSFTYKGKPVKVKQVSEELGVRYVLEGSVRREGERVRITAQLIDALMGHHLWAERYDRELKDLFSVQDDITKNIITAVHVKLTDGERARVFAKGTSNLHAYLKTAEAQWHMFHHTKDGVLRARPLAEDAIAMDPNYPHAYMTLGVVHGVMVWLGMSQSPGDSMKRCIELMQKAVALDDSFGEAHASLGYWLVMARQYDRAVAEGERGMALDPNSDRVLQFYAATLMFVGRREEAIPLFREALRINPKPPNVYYRQFGACLRDSGRYEEAIAVAKKAIVQEPKDTIAYMVLASSCQLAGREEEAREAAKELLRINPAFSLERLAQTTPHKDRAVADRFIEALRKAGLK